MEKFTNISLKNIAWFYDTDQKGQLDMSPSYQRNIVWTDRQKSYLIDSILNGFPIPEIYLQEEIKEDGSAKYIIVDGQQRMRAVLEYLGGKYGLNLEDSPQFSGARFADLDAEKKKSIFKYNFIVRSLPELPENTIREIFKRLNQNVVSLNRQELRRAAYSGPFIKLIEQYAELEFWTDIHLFTPNDVKRMRDEEYISELALSVVEGITNKKDRLEDFYAESEVYFPEDRKILISTSFDLIIKSLRPIASVLSKTRWHNKTDFYTIFNSLLNCKSFLPLTEKRSKELGEKLTIFSDEVYNWLKRDGSETEEGTSPIIVKYSHGVRSATDISARSARQDAMNEFMSEFFQDC